jgi:hypothetical protein
MMVMMMMTLLSVCRYICEKMCKGEDPGQMTTEAGAFMEQASTSTAATGATADV